jgi:hypothetical protein
MAEKIISVEGATVPIEEAYHHSDASRFWLIGNLPPADKLVGRMAISQLSRRTGMIEPFWFNPFHHGECLPGYSAIVKQPMWLSRAIRRFESDTGTTQGLVNDIHLMFQNAYNYTLATRRKSASSLFLNQTAELYESFCREVQSGDVDGLVIPELLRTRPVDSDRCIHNAILKRHQEEQSELKRFKALSVFYFQAENDQESEEERETFPETPRVAPEQTNETPNIRANSKYFVGDESIGDTE